MDRSTAWSTTPGGVSLLFSLAPADEKANASRCLMILLLLLSDPPHAPTDDITAEEFRELLDLNLISYFLASKVKFPVCVQVILRQQRRVIRGDF